MSLETQILQACAQDRGAFNRLVPIIKKKALSSAGWIIYKAMLEYYSKDAETQSIDTTLLSTQLSTKYDRHPLLRDVVDSLLKEVSIDNVVSAYIEYYKSSIGTVLAESLLEQDRERVAELIEEYRLCDSLENMEDAKEYCGTSVLDVLSDHHKGSIPIYPKDLNDTIGGGAAPGNHIVIFARPEIGKTAFVLNLTSYILKSEHKVLYLGNEDPGARITARMISRLSNMTIPELETNHKEAERIIKSKGYDLYTYRDIMPGTPTEIEELVATHKPDVLIVDQLRNVETKSDSMTQKLEALALNMRSLAKRRNIVILSVLQAGDTATDKLVLDYSDVEYSKTGIAAQADLMIGIGSNEEFYRENKLMINVCKNKLNGWHGSLPVRVNRQLSNIASIGE